MSTIDSSIRIIEYMLKKKKARVDEYSRKSTTSENEKIFIGDETQLIKACEELIKTFKRDKDAHFGKMPPQSLELERKVLGAILLENKLENIKSFLLPEHFYSHQHEEIYASCLKTEKLDLSTLIIQLRKDGKLEIAGGAYYLAELMGMVSASTHLEFHARILIELAIKRQLITTCGSILIKGYEDATDCFELLEEGEKEFSNIRAWIKQ